MCHFWKRMSQSTLLPVALLNWLTHWSVVNTCSHWWRYWRLRELQESCSKALEPTWREQDRVHHGQPRTLDWQGCSYLLYICCAELSHQNNLNDTTIGELPASHEPRPCLSPRWGRQFYSPTIYLLWFLVHSFCLLLQTDSSAKDTSNNTAVGDFGRSSSRPSCI